MKILLQTGEARTLDGVGLHRDTDVLGRANVVLIKDVAEFPDGTGRVHEDQTVGTVGLAPLQEWRGHDIVESQNGKGLIESTVVFTPPEVGGGMRVVGARVFIGTEHESGALIAEFTEAIERVERIVERATGDAMEIRANTETDGHDGVVIEFAREDLRHVGTAEAQEAFDAPGLENFAKATQGETRCGEPKRVETIAEFGRASRHAIMDPREMRSRFPGTFFGVERDDAKTGLGAHGAGFPKVTHHVDDAGVGDITVLGRECPYAGFGGSGYSRTVTQGQGNR